MPFKITRRYFKEMSSTYPPSQTKPIRWILFFFLCSTVCFTPLYGQGKVEMTKPQLMLVNDTLIIRYGFTGSKPWDVFNVRLEITDSSGRSIPAKSFTGDIGDSIYGGQQKIILWNMAADGIYVSENIYIEVISKKLDAIEIPIAQTLPGDSLPDQPASYNTPVTAEKEEKTPVYRKNNILLSAVVPGWGLTRLSDGKPYWLIGVAGFGCIASSIYFNRQAVTSYDNYKGSLDMNESQDYFDKAEQQYLISNICAYTAIAIWVVDLGIVTLRDLQVRKSMSDQKLSRLSVGPGYHGSTRTAFVALNYRF
jgi:hypothetical protein